MPPACRLNETYEDRLARAIERETRFGVGGTFKQRHEHAVMDADWSVARDAHAPR